MNHPHGSLPNILTFMWCIWKSRNDHLFGGKQGAPYQIHQMAHAITQNLELVDAIDFDSLEVNPTISSSHGKHQLSLSEAGLSQPRATIKYDMLIKGSKIFSNVAMKTKKKRSRSPGSCREWYWYLLSIARTWNFHGGRRYSKLKLQHFFLQQVSPMSSIYRR
jgi:hypothetical protein